MTVWLYQLIIILLLYRQGFTKQSFEVFSGSLSETTKLRVRGSSKKALPDALDTRSFIQFWLKTYYFG